MQRNMGERGKEESQAGEMARKTQDRPGSRAWHRLMVTAVVGKGSWQLAAGWRMADGLMPSFDETLPHRIFTPQILSPDPDI